ncbi:MAG TPA: signal peptidase II [Candidatus Limnocylindrales bacterium]|nr:signal peptidase II [Candidatus Limnocylindrales bacterium]
MTSRPGTRVRWPLFIGLAVAIVVVDQATKAVVTGSLRPGESRPIIGDLVRIVFSQNSGALFGLFKDNAAMFGIFSLGVIALIVVYHSRTGGSTYMTLTLGLLLGGAIGNMLDRLRLGYVVDFVDGGLGNVRWYTFNVADAAISLAIVLLFVAALRPSLAEPVRPAAAAAGAEAGPATDASPAGADPVAPTEPRPAAPGGER